MGVTASASSGANSSTSLSGMPTPHGRAYALNCLGIAATAHGDYARASTLLERRSRCAATSATSAVSAPCSTTSATRRCRQATSSLPGHRFEESADFGRRLGRDDLVTMAETNFAASSSRSATWAAVATFS